MSREQSNNLEIVRGGMWGRRDTRSYAMRQAALVLRERLVELMGGKRKSRALNSVQAGVTNPLGGPLKLAAHLKDERVRYEDARRIVIGPQEKALATMYGRSFDTGEHTPPRAA